MAAAITPPNVRLTRLPGTVLRPFVVDVPPRDRAGSARSITSSAGLRRLSNSSCSARGLAKLVGLGLEHAVEAVLGKLDAGREPEAVAGDLPHVLDDAAQRERAARPADDVRVHRERDVLRPLRRALRIEL